MTPHEGGFFVFDVPRSVTLRGVKWAGLGWA